MTRTKESRLTASVKLLLNAYEDFYLEPHPGIHGYVMQLRTNVLIHRWHTKRDLFFPHACYQGTSITDLPNLQWLEFWLKNARQAAQKFLNKGEYQSEEKIGSDYQSVKRKYTHWIYYDRNNRVLVGEVERAGSSTSVRANTKSKRELAPQPNTKNGGK